MKAKRYLDQSLDFYVALKNKYGQFQVHKLLAEVKKNLPRYFKQVI
jgi:hypothetical protein